MEYDYALPPHLLGRLESAERVVVLTGAGVSAESGVPTFRGEQGLWKNFSPEKLATPEAFNANPALVWEWYDWRRTIIAPLAPNAGHKAIAEMESLFPSFTLVTQNVDGLHKRAGSTDPIELHGNIWLTRCLGDGAIAENREIPLSAIPPKCKQCGVMVRPHIVWFGEALDPRSLNMALERSVAADVFIVAGTPGAVHPAASLAGYAKRNGGIIIEINLEPTSLSHDADITLFGPSSSALSALVTAIKKTRH